MSAVFLKKLFNVLYSLLYFSNMLRHSTYNKILVGGATSFAVMLWNFEHYSSHYAIYLCHRLLTDCCFPFVSMYGESILCYNVFHHNILLEYIVLAFNLYFPC